MAAKTGFDLDDSQFHTHSGHSVSLEFNRVRPFWGGTQSNKLLNARMNKLQNTFKLTSEGKLPKLSSMQCKKYGIYAFIVGGQVIRFGESASGFGRIQKGFNHQLYKGNGKKNYIAYHFREKFKNQEIEIRYYSFKGLLETPDARRTIEAELAYQFRVKTGAWPRVMIEIHFSNKINKNSSVFINKILEDLCI